ncbi:MAG TPA: sulfatase [Planctomycetota bacterium]|nr:sulfatase [Planctomycetota bacterium]
MSRGVVLSTLLAAAPFAGFAALAGCTDADGGAVEPDAFPLRVLEGRDGGPGDEHTVLLDELDSLEDWWALVPAAGGALALEPAAERAVAGGLVQDDGRVLLPPGMVLLRRVTLERSSEHALSARLRGPVAGAGDRCPNLLLLPARSPDGQEFIDPADPGASQLERLGQRLRDGWETGAGEWSVWRQAADGTGFALARWLEWIDVATPQGEARWIALAAFDRELEVDRVRLTVSPRLVPGSDASTALPEDHGDIAIERVRIGGDSRLAAFVPAREVLSLPIEVPEQAVDLVLGVCPDPALITSLRPGERRATRWTVHAQPGNHLLVEVGETVTNARELRFTDHVLAWPAGLSGAVTLEFGVVGGAGMVFGQPRVRGPERPGAPSLLLVSIDTLRADHLGFLGYGRPTSPYLDELAARGAVFTDVTAVSSYTLPTHASMLTGLFPPRHLALDTSDRLNTERTPTLAMRLGEAGYHTAGFTGGGFMSHDYGFAAGFDRYTTVDPVAQRPGRENEQAEVVSSWIRRQGRRSWFGFLHTYAAHDYAPPAEDLAVLARSADPPEGFDPYELLDRRDARVSPPTPDELDRLVDRYDAGIHHVDRWLRDLIEPLRAEGLLDDTWIVITSDHGEEFLEHGRLRHTGSLYQELVHVPLLIVPPDAAARAGSDPAAVPGAGAALRIDEPVSQVDLLPTLLDLLGQPVPAGTDGRSLAGCLRGGQAADDATPLYSHLDRYLYGRSSLRSGRWKLVRGDTSAERLEPAMDEWQLFDLEADAGERRDLEAERSEELSWLRLLLDDTEAAFRAQAGERARFQPDEELLQRLTELGYVESRR